MTPMENIAGDLEPEAASPSPTSESPATARPQRGHGPKIAEAVAALRAEGKLLPNLRPTYRDKLITAWLTAAGYEKSEIPSRFAIRRYLRSEG